MIAETEDDLIKRLNEWKDNVKNRGMRVNTDTNPKPNPNANPKDTTNPIPNPTDPTNHNQPHELWLTTAIVPGFRVGFILQVALGLVLI